MSEQQVRRPAQVGAYAKTILKMLSQLTYRCEVRRHSIWLFGCALIILVFIAACDQRRIDHESLNINLSAVHDKDAGTISVYKDGGQQILLTQTAAMGVRPYIHPIIAPDGVGELTEFSPAHHKHQTGLYWGLKEVNGRDYFMNWKGDYWKWISAEVTQRDGPSVAWRTVYELLDENGMSIMRETQHWTVQTLSGKYLIDFEWHGEALTDVTMGKFYVGGLFLRMPWRLDTPGEVVNAAGQRNNLAEGQRAIWNDIGIKVPGRKDLAHIAIFDHPGNTDFPIGWRVDNEMGIGPSRQILGDWKIDKGKKEVFRYRLLVYTGDFQRNVVMDAWSNYVCSYQVVTTVP